MSKVISEAMFEIEKQMGDQIEAQIWNRIERHIRGPIETSMWLMLRKRAKELIDG